MIMMMNMMMHRIVVSDVEIVGECEKDPKRFCECCTRERKKACRRCFHNTITSSSCVYMCVWTLAATNKLCVSVFMYCVYCVYCRFSMLRASFPRSFHSSSHVCAAAAAASSGHWAAVPQGTLDAIKALTERYIRDEHPSKVTLGEGVYRNGEGQPQTLESVVQVSPGGGGVFHHARLVPGSHPLSLSVFVLCVCFHYHCWGLCCCQKEK